MNGNNLDPKAAAPVPFPDDLRVWLGPERVVALVQAAVQGLEPEPPAASLPSSDGHRVPLALLVYAYVTKRYGSEDVVEDLETDPALQQLSTGRLFDAAQVRRLRRLRRGPLSVAILRTLWLAAERRRGEVGLAWPRVDPVDLVRCCAEKAEVLLDRAVLADTVALDV